MCNRDATYADGLTVVRAERGTTRWTHTGCQSAEVHLHVQGVAGVSANCLADSLTAFHTTTQMTPI